MTNARETLINLASSLAKYAEDNERISLPIFTVKLAKAHLDYPEDYTIGMMSTVVGKMANSDKLFISRAEIKDLYEKFYSRNTKFANVFSEELGKKDLVEPKQTVSYDALQTDLMQDAVDSMVDPVLVNSLNIAFGGEPIQEYSNSSERYANNACVNEFKSLGFNIKSSVVSGLGHTLICSAGFETPRGTTSVLVPVKIVAANTAMVVPVFVGNDGVKELNKENIVSYLTSRAGQALKVNARECLIATLNASGSDTEISDVDLALTKMNAKKESSTAYAAPQVLGIEVEDVNHNLILDLPKVEDKEISSIAKSFDSELGFASFKFGKNIVNQGASVVKSKLNECNINDCNIAVHSSNDDSITYAVSLNGGSASFKTPVKIISNKASPPSIIICDGSVNSFDKQTVSKLLVEKGFDRTASISASPLYGLKGSELVNIVKSAVVENNYIKAEDALNILANSDDDKAYQTALTVFTNGLKQSQTEANIEENHCSMVVRSSHSQHELCGHTGLPLHKVYQDKLGNCRPIYRKAMDESYDGVNFMNSKVYL